MSNLTGTFARAAPVLAAVQLLPLATCAKSPQADTSGATARSIAAPGDPARGYKLVDKLGCGSCHVIPGVEQADGMVGPPLDHIASRQYLAGVLRNTPLNMDTWLRHPQQIVPGNAMPNLGISETDGRDIAAYLATLK